MGNDGFGMGLWKDSKVFLGDGDGGERWVRLVILVGWVWSGGPGSERVAGVECQVADGRIETAVKRDGRGSVHNANIRARAVGNRGRVPVSGNVVIAARAKVPCGADASSVNGRRPKG